MRVRARIVGLLGHKLSGQTYIAENVYFAGAGLTTEGKVSINAGSFIDAFGSIHIDGGVRIACEVMLVTTTHRMGPPGLRADAVEYRPICIGSGAWIGARATILPGVTIAPGCIIAAGAVVTQDTIPDGLYAGVPARRVRSII